MVLAIVLWEVGKRWLLRIIAECWPGDDFMQ